MLIACDIDGVVADCDGPFLHGINQKLGTNLCRNDLTTYYGVHDLIKDHFASPEEIQLFLNDLWWGEGFLSKQPPYLASIRALPKIAGFGKLHMVTARQVVERPWVATETRSWLDRHGIPYDKLVFEQDKVSYCLTHKARYLIEDAPHTAEKAAEAGIAVFLVDAPYNQHVSHPLVRRIETLLEVAPAIEFDEAA